MTFSTWCRVVMSNDPAEPILLAQMDNLCREDRIAEIDEIRGEVAKAFSDVGTADVTAARAGVKRAQTKLYDDSCGLLGLIPSVSDEHESYQAVSYLTAAKIERSILPSFNSRAASLPERLRLPNPLFLRFAPRFLWTTFAEQMDGLGPTDIAQSLGLPHFGHGQTVYKISLGRWPKEVYIPTCMDSGIFEAWMRPPKDHEQPWGVTRHLITGAPAKAELLVQVADVEGAGLVAERVGEVGECISDYTPDLIIGRDFSSYAA